MVAAMAPANNVAKRDMFSSRDRLIALKGSTLATRAAPNVTAARYVRAAWANDLVTR
jgi:hypothetical protein